MNARHRAAHAMGVNQKRGSVLRSVPSELAILQPGERFGKREWDGKRQMWWIDIEEVVCVKCGEDRVVGLIAAGARDD